ncbi:MAG: hypothetical protein V4629_12015 [Pseudomonadota bacterium]
MLTDSVKKNSLLLKRNSLQDLLNKTLKQYHIEDPKIEIDFGIPIVFLSLEFENSIDEYKTLHSFALQHFECSVLPIGYNSQYHRLILHPVFNARPTPLWLLSHLLFWGYCLSKNISADDPLPYPWRKERLMEWLKQKHFISNFKYLKKAHELNYKILFLPALSIVY